ncbi:MAG: hypothetical protein KGI51_06435 [Rhodospirillales bacterium]|nr:hypothetical protein [Rhodospirillales bacterium]
MPLYSLSIPPRELVRVFAAEIVSASGVLEFYHAAYRDYVIEEEFDRPAYGLAGRTEYDFIVSRAVLDVEVGLKWHDWVLSIVARTELGPRMISDENALLGVPMTLADFDAVLRTAGPGAITVRLRVPRSVRGERAQGSTPHLRAGREFTRQVGCS